MIIDGAKSTEVHPPDCDVLVVGSGPVGLILARALDARGFRALVLEAGARETAERQLENSDVSQEGEPLDCVSEARTRQVGGGLNLWGGQLCLLEPCDLDNFDGWPVKYREVYASIDEVFDILGLKGRGIAARLTSIFGQSVGDEPSGSDDLRLIETAWLPRPKLARSFWKWLEASPTCQLWCNSTCVGLNGSQSSMTGARVAIGSSETRIANFRAAFVVLAAGTLENARLLMLPSPSHEFSSWQQNKWLGRGFNEHLDASVGRVIVRDRKALAQKFDPYVRAGIKYTPKLAWRNRTAASTRLGACGVLSYSISPSQLIHDVGVLAKNIFLQPTVSDFTHFPRAVLTSSRYMLPLVARYIASGRIGRPAHSTAYFRVSVEQPVRANSVVRLSSSTLDRSGMPQCILNWHRADAELETIAEFTTAANKWLIASGIGHIEIEPSLAAKSSEFWKFVNSGLHHAGTTRMGADEDDGVVDANLRVYGTQNLFVCGASVFPKSGYANPTLTAMSLAVRLASHLSAVRAPYGYR